ncbi:LPD1 domain-containing protein [Robertmurraya beringensis]|uniref:LPD1 domain-containing protein n=1 Tax=Robertmurraya beringensis TaxID=641660 RepID=A0ABV6KUD2_9BACI
MENQMSLFNVEESNVAVLDIRSEQQINKKVSYDVGEKIGLARKDLAALRKGFEDNQTFSALEEIENISSVLAAQIITKSELFKSFSLEKEKENCTKPSVARAKQLIIQRVDATPMGDSKESREQYMKAAQFVLHRFEMIKEMEELYSFISDVSSIIRNEGGNRSFYEKRIDELLNMQNELEKGSKDYEIVVNRLENCKVVMRGIDRSNRLGLSSLGKKFCNLFKSQTSYSSTIRNALKVESWDDLLGKKEKKSSGKRKAVWERTLPERPDRIGGAQSTVEKPEDLVQFFGFRGVEFGHYVDDSKATEHLLRSSEAMMDLAELLEVDYSFISLDGTLAMAFGARGRGGSALAHYEPYSNVINMTKQRGCLGIFAHEFWHGYDCYLYRISHNGKYGKLDYASNPDTLGSHIDPLVPILFAELIEVIKKGKSVAYFENTNDDKTFWRGTEFKSCYRRHNGDLLAAMNEKVESAKAQLESDIQFYSRISIHADQRIEKAKKAFERNIKKFAQALAWFHEQQTGERVERIPYPTDKSNYYQASISLDKGKVDKYWSSNVELTARAFESYIQDKLVASGRRSDYLVAGTRTDNVAFPMGEERTAINDKFDLIFKYLRDIEILK